MENRTREGPGRPIKGYYSASEEIWWWLEEGGSDEGSKILSELKYILSVELIEWTGYTVWKKVKS